VETDLKSSWTTHHIFIQFFLLSSDGILSTSAARRKVTFSVAQIRRTTEQLNTKMVPDRIDGLLTEIVLICNDEAEIAEL